MADEKAKSPAPETANKSQSLSDIVKAVKATQEKQTDISEQETSSEPKENQKSVVQPEVPKPSISPIKETPPPKEDKTRPAAPAKKAAPVVLCQDLVQVKIRNFSLF